MTTLPFVEDPAPRPKRRKRAESEADPYKVVCVRLRSAEFDQFSKDVEAMGLTGSMALRIAARRVAGFIEVDEEVRRLLEDILRAIGSISGAIRDAHASYLAFGSVDLDRLEAQKIAFGEQFTQLDGLLRAILNVSRRRGDGKHLLVDAAK